jgi:hypothetical protein
MFTPFETSVFNEMLDELSRADTKYAHDPMVEPLVGLKTIQCELTELEREVSRDKPKNHLMRKEALQVMTMAYKFIRDIC